MAIALRQSTASQEVPLGPFLDITDANTEETAITLSASEILVWKTGATSLVAKNSGDATHMQNGIFYAVLDATDTNTIGPLVIFARDTAALWVRLECVVYDEAVYDSLFGTTALSTFAGGAVASVTGAVGSVTGNVGGNVTGSVGSVASGGITAASIAADAITAAKIADGAIDAATFAAGAINAAAIAADAITDAKVAADVTIASVTGAVGSVTGNVGGNVTGSVGSVASGGITAASFAANAITAAKLDPDVTTELQAGLATATALQTVDDEIATIDANVDTLLTRITSTLFTGITSLAEWLGLMAGKQTGNTTARTELRATGAGSGTYTETTDSLEAVRDRGDAAWITATGFSTHSAADVWAAGTRTLTAGTNIVLAKGVGVTGFNDLSAAQVNSEVDTALVDIHLDHLLAVTYDPASKPGAADALFNELVENDGGVARYTANALEQGPGGGSAPTAAQIADAVWQEAIADHSGTVGSTAEALNAAGAAGDPWTTQLPGAYGAGSAGKIIGDNVNATVSSRATQTSVDTIDGIVDTILVDTNELQTDWVNGGRLDVILDARASQTSVDDLPTNAELATSQAAADDATLAAIAALNNLSAAQVRTELTTELARIDVATSTRASQASVDDLPTNAELATSQAGADDATLAAIAALNNLSAAQVNAEVDTALADYDAPTKAELDAAVDALPTAAENAAAVLAAAVSNPIDANVQEINDVTLTGDGSATPWGPV